MNSILVIPDEQLSAELHRLGVHFLRSSIQIIPAAPLATPRTLSQPAAIFEETNPIARDAPEAMDSNGAANQPVAFEVADFIPSNADATDDVTAPHAELAAAATLRNAAVAEPAMRASQAASPFHKAAAAPAIEPHA